MLLNASTISLPPGRSEGILVKRYQMINIKLDKTEGLTEALLLARAAKERKLGLMVGNMLCTSLSMAPTFVVLQYGQLADLDGPLFLWDDRAGGLTFNTGEVSMLAAEFWGVIILTLKLSCKNQCRLAINSFFGLLDFRAESEAATALGKP